MVTSNQKIHVVNSNRSKFPDKPNTKLDNVKVSFDLNLAGKNLLINRNIIYPKTVENTINNHLSNTDLILESTLKRSIHLRIQKSISKFMFI